MTRWPRSVTPSFRHCRGRSTALRESLAHTPPVRRAAADRARPVTMRLAKRLLDLSVALPCLILAAPLLLAVAVAIRLTTPGPALFRQVRVGRHRRPFELCKFRTMYTGCPDEVHREYVRKLLTDDRSEEHTSELQSPCNLVCR